MASNVKASSSKRVIVSKTVATSTLSSNPTGHTYVKPEKKSNQQKDTEDIKDVMRDMGATGKMSVFDKIQQKKLIDSENATAPPSSSEPDKMRHLQGSMAVNLTGIAQRASPTMIPGGLQTVEKITSVKLGEKSRTYLGRESTQIREVYRTWKLPERVFLASDQNKRELQFPPDIRYPKFGAKKFGEGERKVPGAMAHEGKEEVKTRLTTQEKAQLTTKGARQAAAEGARKILTAVGAMRETEPHLTLETRRHTAAVEKLRGPAYAAEKLERVTQLEEEAEKMLEVKEPVNVQEYAARFANFGGGFGPEIFEYHPVFDAERTRAERVIAERCKDGVRLLRRKGHASSKPEPKFDSWEARKRGELKAGFRSKDIAELKRKEKMRLKKEKRLEMIAAKKAKGEKVEEEEEAEEAAEAIGEYVDICPGRVCKNRPCHKPTPLPQRYQREFPDFPQYNTCVLVGNWVEERRCYVTKPRARFSIYSFDYRKPIPPVPYTKSPYYANMFSHRGLPYDVLFTHGALPPPRRWTTEPQPPCDPCCEKISCCTESRAQYVAPPKESYVTCRYATPKALSSSSEPISRNIWNLHLRGDQLRMVPPMPCR